MAIRNYVGARYVPKFADPIEWQANTSYEAMVIVTYNNASYTSKVPVPPTVGNPAENSTYWALTGNYNAQVEEYRKATAEAQEHARDGICAVDEGISNTASKSVKAHEYFWWRGKLYRAKENINAGALISDGGNAEEGNVADGVSANSTDIDTLTNNVSRNTSYITLLNDNINSNSRNIQTLQTNVNTNTNDISELKTKTGTNTNNISELKTKDTEIEGKVNTNTNDISSLKITASQHTHNINDINTDLNNFSQNFPTMINSHIQYKVYTTARNSVSQETTDTAALTFNQTTTQFTESVPAGVTLIPISAECHYFKTIDEYNNNSNKGHMPIQFTTNIWPAYNTGGTNTYTITLMNKSTWTAVGYYWKVGVLEIKQI